MGGGGLLDLLYLNKIGEGPHSESKTSTPIMVFSITCVIVSLTLFMRHILGYIDGQQLDY